MEADHLGGDVPMVPVIDALLAAGARRHAGGDPHWRFRCAPITGMSCWTMSVRGTFPGYPVIGRLRGLARIARRDDGGGRPSRLSAVRRAIALICFNDGGAPIAFVAAKCRFDCRISLR